MCGIAGIVQWDRQSPAIEDVQAMCDAMIHRGPDDEGYYHDGRAALGMRRLSIIDLQTGHQPVSNEDGTVWVVFNGEIYNFRELRRELEGRGHRFSTTSDTETIVHLYEDYGARAVDKLRGMFAFAVWDTKRQALLVARDRLGIKPLFYAPIPGGIAFASELKSMLQVPQIRRSVSWSALGHFLTFGCSPGTESIVDGVQKLEPGHLLAMADGSTKIERYWNIQFSSDSRATENDLVDQLRVLLRASVDIHLRSDVPVGAFLSGGIDSSAVVATMTDLLDRPIKTFSIGSSVARFDELKHARDVSRTFRTEHHELVVGQQSVDILEDLAWFQDEPLADSSLIPTYMVSKLAAEHVKVVLTGDGGDEIFAGYDRYLVEQRERQRDRLPWPLRSALGAIGSALPETTRGRNFLRHLSYEGPRRYLDSMTVFGAMDQMQLLAPTAREQVLRADPLATALKDLRRGDDWLSALQYWDLQCNLPLDILPKVDRMTMAHSIEARPALLDHRIVEFAASVPPHLRLKGTTTKYLFKQAMRGVLPDAIIDRSKQGFAVPLSQWFSGGWSGFVRDLLLSDTCRQRGIFEPARIAQLLEQHDGGRDLSCHLWALTSFELWCRSYLDGRGRGRLLPRSRSERTAVAVPAMPSR